jgi:hypothetical protein
VTNRSWWAQFWSAFAGRAGLHQPCRAALVDALARIEAQGAVIRKLWQLHHETDGVCPSCNVRWPCPTALVMGVEE